MTSRVSTRAAALQLVALCIGGLRLATLVQMAPSAVPALGAGPRLLTAATWLVAVLALGGLAALVLVRREPTGAPYAVADVAVAVVLLAAAHWTVPEDLRFGSWIGFGPGYTLCVACSLSGVRSPRLWAGLLVVLAAAEAAYLAPTVDGWADVPSLASNVLTILVIGPLVWVCTRMLVRIGTEADAARRLAADAAQAEEERRARTAIHNGTAVMRLLVDSGLDERQPGLRKQAEIELNRMRAYLAGNPHPTTGARTTLAAVVTAAGAEFDDLATTVVADLAQDVVLDRPVADDLATALRSLLLNVRLHAQARQVVLHAGEREDGRGWEVSVHDDGVGFEPATASYGVGIRDVVVAQLARWGVTTTVDSVPDVGTTVTLVREEEP